MILLDRIRFKHVSPRSVSNLFFPGHATNLKLPLDPGSILLSSSLGLIVQHYSKPANPNRRILRESRTAQVDPKLLQQRPQYRVFGILINAKQPLNNAPRGLHPSSYTSNGCARLRSSVCKIRRICLAPYTVLSPVSHP
jgi:hypothetical protein